MTCTVCGTPLPGGVERCPRCGTYVAAPPSPNVPPTVAVPPVNQGASPTPPTMFAPHGMYPGGQGEEQFPPTAYAPSNQRYPYPQQQAPNAYPNNNYAPPTPPNNQYGGYQQGVPPLPQSVPPLPRQYGQTSDDSGSGKKGSRSLIIGLVALVIILLIGSIPILLARSNNKSSQSQQTTSTGGATTAKGTAQSKATNPPSVGVTPTVAAPTLPNEKNPYPPRTGTLVLKDPMRNNSQGYMWQEGSNNGTTCRFNGGKYHATKASGSALCVPQSPAVAAQNLTVEADLTLQSGTYMGLATRIDPQQGTGYLFVVGTDGTYAINQVNIKATGSGQVRQIRQGFSQAMPLGANQVKMAVVVRGSQLTLFVNNQQIDSVNDSRLNNSGSIGVFVNGNSALDLAVSNVRVWKL
jgi:hypothetical protein